MFPTYNRRQLDRRRIARIVNDIRTTIKSPDAGAQSRALNAAKELQAALRGISRDLDQNLAGIVDLADKAVRSQNVGWISHMAGMLAKSEHPIGQLLASQMKRKRDLQFGEQMETRLKSAASILQQIEPELFGGKRIDPEKAGGRKVQFEPPSLIRDDKPLPPGVEYIGNGYIRIRAPGFVRFYREDDPIVTGKPIKVQSSNVHSISFRINPKSPDSSLLFVRYLQADGGYGNSPNSKNKVPGPTYGYRGVHPDLFKEFQRAISKGVFVWDKLRQRGTIHGHQYPYFLARIAQMYMPRRAQMERGGQVWLRKRRNAAMLSGGRLRAVESRLNDRMVGVRRPRRRVNPRPPRR